MLHYRDLVWHNQRIYLEHFPVSQTKSLLHLPPFPSPFSPSAHTWWTRQLCCQTHEVCCTATATLHLQSSTTKLTASLLCSTAGFKEQEFPTSAPGVKLTILVSTSHKTADRHGLQLIFGGGNGDGEGDGKEDEQEWRCITPHIQEGRTVIQTLRSFRWDGWVEPCSLPAQLLSYARNPSSAQHFPPFAATFLMFAWWEIAPQSSHTSTVSELETCSPIPVLSLASSLLSIFQLQLPNTRYDVWLNRKQSSGKMSNTTTLQNTAKKCGALQQWNNPTEQYGLG